MKYAGKVLRRMTSLPSQNDDFELVVLYMGNTTGWMPTQTWGPEPVAPLKATTEE